MGFNLVRDGRLRLLHGVALVLLGVTAGCSSGVTRFTDGLVTASTGSAQPIDNTPYVMAPVDDTYPVAQAPAAPSGGAVQRAQLSAPAAQGSMASAPQQPAPVRTAQLPQPIDPLSQSVARDAQTYTPAPKSSSISGSYKVESGDTLAAISRRSGVSIAALRAANGIDGENIRIGQTLKIPSGSAPLAKQVAPVVAKVEDAKPKPALVETKPAVVEQPKQAAQQPKEDKPKVVAYTPPSSGKAVAEAAQADDGDAPNSTGISKMRWPVKGRIISNFGQGTGNYRDGIDIQVPPGTSVKAAENGVVIYAGDGLKDFGNTVLVRHEDGLVTVYGNASELKVKRGQTVKRGQEVALSGVSSANETPKLHFEVRKDSAAVDPKGFLQ